MKNKEIGKKCGESTLLSGHRNIGSSEFKRNLYGCFWGGRERKKSLKEIFNEIWPLARNQSSDHRNLYGIYTEI